MAKRDEIGDREERERYVREERQQDLWVKYMSQQADTN